ncbi:MAG: hypothetical protein ABL984_04965 [Pyrinomonadaceae bacterium]
MFNENETLEQRRARKAHIKSEYGRLFDVVCEILFRHDPIGINFEDNTDEYEPEVETILPRLRGCSSSDEALNVIHEEFQKWFGEAGPRKKYTQISEEIWAAWCNSELGKK